MTPVGSDSTRVLEAFPQPAERSASRGHRVFATILRSAGAIAAAAIPGAGPVIGAVLGSAGRRNAPLLGRFGGSSETLAYLELQREIERETRIYETASNILKARHDATMSSIRNIKS